MINFIKPEIKNLGIIIVLFCICLFVFFLKQGSIIIDTGREFYIPMQMLKGQVLYKDIFNIYGPLSYQFNELLFSIFGQKILTLYWAGIINSFIILMTVYFLSREFLDKFFSLLITLFVMFSCVFGADLFNYNLPYSYAMVYALSSFLLSLLFLIKYIKEDKNIFLYLSSLFAGISIANKYDFVFYLILIIYTAYFIKHLKIQKLFIAGLFLSAVPVCSFVILFFKGVDLGVLKHTVYLYLKMSETPSMHYFYSNFSGTYLNLSIMAAMSVSFILFCILCLFLSTNMLVTQKIQNKSLKVIIYTIYFLISLICGFILFVKPFALLPLINFLLLIIFSKFIFNNKPLLILMLSAFLSSFKGFFNLSMYTYGIFIIPLILISILSFIFCYLKSKDNGEKVYTALYRCIVIILCSYIFIFGLVNFMKVQKRDFLLETSKGNIYVNSALYDVHKKVVDYILIHTKKNDRIIILPETPMINFLTDRDSDNFYNSLIPLYIETFGEANIISHFKKTKPEYFIFTNRSTEDYGKKFFCKDYSQDLCGYILKNYVADNKNHIYLQDNNYKFEIFKRKDNK